ncbi:MAG: adenylosuccinate synthetase, partial [Ruminococcus sp.]
MKKAFAVIGANFGDEGKGLMTDFFCSQNKKSLNIRFNGGAQAGHTVVAPDGKRHVFSHIGSGFFCGADTYLSEFFIVNPIMFLKEYFFPLSETKIYISENACISLPCDMMINQFAENSRGEKRHGSCGLGIYETVTRNSSDFFKIRFGDNISGNQLREKIRYINSVYVPQRLENLGFESIPKELSELLYD